jgi:hypothetical protein
MSLGHRLRAFAHELSPDQHAHANALLAGKYGEEYGIDGSGSEEDDGENQDTFIVIESVQQ